MSQEPIPSKRGRAEGGGDEAVALSGRGGGAPCLLTPLHGGEVYWRMHPITLSMIQSIIPMQ